MSMSDLLRAHGFHEHPFSTWMAENEERELKNWYVQPYFFEELLGRFGPGTSTTPGSHLIFGPPGGGKTALRKMLEAELLSRSPSSLLIRYVDFSRVVGPDRPRPQLSHHIDELLRLATTSLLGFWSRSQDRYSHLSVVQRAELAGLVFQFYEKLPPAAKVTYTTQLSPYGGKAIAIATAGKTLVEVYNGVVSVLNREKIERTNWEPADDSSDPMLRLQRFWHLASAMGVERVWVMVDGVDEQASLKTGEAIVKSLAEILLNQRVIEFREEEKQVVCFKVFLTRPDEIKPILLRDGYREDRVPIREIEWSRKQLDLAFKNRLYHFSSGKVLSFDDLCDPHLKGTHDRLLDECNLNPRTLFLMASGIFSAFQSNSEPGISKLDKESIDKGIAVGKPRTGGSMAAAAKISGF